MSEDKQPVLHRVGEFGSRIGSRPPRSKKVRIAVQLGIAILIFAFLVLTVAAQWGEIKEEGIHFKGAWLIPAFLVIPLFYVLGGVGWDLILRFLGYRIGFLRAQVAWGQPLLARYVPGSVLYLLARLLLAERAGVPRRTTLASIVYEQALSAAAAVAVATYFLIDHPDLQGQPLRWGVLAVVPLALIVLHPRVFRPMADWVLGKFGREPLPDVMPLRGVVVMICFYALNWTLIGVGVFFVARAVSFIPASDIPIIGSAQAVGYVAALVTLIAPAGLGVRDAAFAWTVKEAVSGRSFALGSLIAIAARAVLTVVEVIYAGVVTLIGRRQGWALAPGFEEAESETEEELEEAVSSGEAPAPTSGAG
jgi:uncharacterized membrane protein YbhN (UPF0104 family)